MRVQNISQATIADAQLTWKAGLRRAVLCPVRVKNPHGIGGWVDERQVPVLAQENDKPDHDGRSCSVARVVALAAA